MQTFLAFIFLVVFVFAAAISLASGSWAGLFFGGIIALCCLLFIAGDS